jgi:alkaline phosphatase D
MFIPGFIPGRQAAGDGNNRGGGMASIDRRGLLRGGLVLGGAAVASGVGFGGPTRAFASPALVRSGRPAVTHGVQAGDVTASTGVVWARADRPARMLVELSTTESFRHSWLVPGPVVTPASDLTGRVHLDHLPPGQRLFYRVRFADQHDPGLSGAQVAGTFATAPTGRRDLRFLWSGDLAGQGWGINPDFGGYRIFDAMRARQPDFFLNSGDTVYADGPLAATVALPDGGTWRNITTEEKSKVAETLAEYRGQYKYNLLDEPLRRFAASVAQVNQWDDHEVRNNWYPGELIVNDPRYTETRLDVLAARARQAFSEYVPIGSIRPDGEGRIYRKFSYGPLLDLFVLDMRTYKDPNTTDLETARDGGILGRTQTRWLKRELAASGAVWKVIANDLPLGLVVPDGTNIEAVAQGDPGAPKGRELELSDVLSSIRRHRVRNTVWLTADVHYTAALRYEPDRAAFTDFDPFWEFVSGPLNAGTFGPNAVDPTFGPEVVFSRTPPAANAAPSAGYQFFGEVNIDAGSRQLTVTLRDLNGAGLYETRLDPRH